VFDRIEDGSPRALALAAGVIILTFVVLFSGVAVETLGPILQEWQFPAINPPPSLPHTNASDKVIFSVDPASNPRYWRANAYDTYTGTGWIQSNEKINDYSLGSRIEPPVKTYSDKKEYTYTVTVMGQAQGYIPTALNTVKVFNVSGEKKAGVGEYSSFYIYGQFKSYSFTMVQYNYTRDMLVGANVVGSDTAPNYYDLPLSISPTVKQLALNTTTGAKTPYEKALLIASYLKSEEFKYTLTAEPPKKSDWVEWFLFNSKKGKCTDFTTAFVVMARYCDLPARYVTGFALGQIEDGKRVVKNMHGHTWAEVWFDKLGWIAFEVTGSNYENPNEIGPTIDGSDPSIVGGGTGGGTGGSRVGKPDLLFITNMTFSTDRPIRDRKYKIFTTVKNIGNGTCPNALVRFYEYKGTSKRTFSSLSIPSLAQEAEYTLSVDWTPYYMGYVDIWGKIDPDNSIDELNETNNNISTPAFVRSGVDLALDTSSIRFVQQFIIVNDSVKLEISVKNQGDVAAIRNGRVFVWDGGEIVGFVTNLTVNRFDIATVFFTWTMNVSGVHVVTISAMPAPDVKDLDWSNNNITLQPLVRDTLEIEEVVWDDKNGDMLYGKGDVVTVTVRNNMRIGLVVYVVLGYMTLKVYNESTWIGTNESVEVDLPIWFNYIENTGDAAFAAYSPTLIGKADLAFDGGISVTTGKMPGKYTIRAKVWNIGNRTTVATKVSLFEQSTISASYEIGSVDIPALNPGENTTVISTWTPKLSGRVEVLAIIDPQNLTDESNESNNVRSTFINISFAGLLSGGAGCSGCTPAARMENADACGETDRSGVVMKATVLYATKIPAAPAVTTPRAGMYPGDAARSGFYISTYEMTEGERNHG
jgi:transglutaminase-like putative cysteine protease